MLELEGATELIGEAESAEEALRLARQAAPDLIVLDLKLKGERSGIELCREIKALPNPPTVIIYTAYDSPEEVSAALRAGADGYVHKGIGYEQLSEILERTRAGQKVWILKGEDSTESFRRVKAESTPLTPREEEVLSLLLRRRTNDEISRELSISVQTTKTHVSSILKKLGRRTRRDLL